jgi:hypothetical protein
LIILKFILRDEEVDCEFGIGEHMVVVARVGDKMASIDHGKLVVVFEGESSKKRADGEGAVGGVEPNVVVLSILADVRKLCLVPIRGLGRVSSDGVGLE